MSKVEILQDDGQTFVRKTGNVGRNLERLDSLARLDIQLPKVLNVYGNSYDMEYISNYDMKTYFSLHNMKELISFLKHTIDELSRNTIEKNYTPIYESKLAAFPFENYILPFTKDQLIAKLPKNLPSSEYHGDLTLDNVLYRMADESFVLIDPLTTEYDSYIFDLAKLRQDLECGWFIRNESVYYTPKLKMISEAFADVEHFDNDYLLILMLLRVLPYTMNYSDKTFIQNEIRKLWK
jgi:hypothetical protein